ncbi:hypothetical protein ACVWWN_002472 [Mycobacterium sp. URHB0021]
MPIPLMQTPGMPVPTETTAARSLITTPLSRLVPLHAEGFGTTVWATASAMINGLSAMDIVGAMHFAGLPTPNPLDVTTEKCRKLHPHD